VTSRGITDQEPQQNPVLILSITFPSSSFTFTSTDSISAARPSAGRKILLHNGDLTLALAGWWLQLWAGAGCGGFGRVPGWCGCGVESLLPHCCGGAVCWQTRRRASPDQFFLADCGGLSVGWVSCWTLSVGWRACLGRGVIPH
jgi:hypothetical protein